MRTPLSIRIGLVIAGLFFFKGLLDAFRWSVPLLFVSPLGLVTALAVNLGGTICVLAAWNLKRWPVMGFVLICALNIAVSAQDPQQAAILLVVRLGPIIPMLFYWRHLGSGPATTGLDAERAAPPRVTPEGESPTADTDATQPRTPQAPRAVTVAVELGGLVLFAVSGHRIQYAPGAAAAVYGVLDLVFGAIVLFGMYRMRLWAVMAYVAVSLLAGSIGVATYGVAAWRGLLIGLTIRAAVVGPSLYYWRRLL